MKRISVILMSLVLVLSLFTACGSEPVWEANDAFRSLTNYTEGEVVSAEFSSSCSIKIKDNSYENFKAYVEKMKKDGFEYLPFGSAPENYNLSNGSALWRCTNGEIWLQLMFNEDGTEGEKAFGCNLQIFGYDEIPDSWKEASENNKSDKKDKDSKEDKNDKSENADKKTETNK